MKNNCKFPISIQATFIKSMNGVQEMPRSYASEDKYTCRAKLDWRVERLDLTTGDIQLKEGVMNL